MTTAKEDGFLNRWSRRKRGADTETPAHEASVDLADETAIDSDDMLDDAALLEKYDLPDPDGIQPGDSIKDFMRQEVPSRLKRRVLRKLWLSDPVFANLDTLVEYGEDYTDAATVIDNLTTVYQVGKGMLRDVAEPEDDPEQAPVSEEIAAAADDAHAEDDVTPAEPEARESLAPTDSMTDGTSHEPSLPTSIARHDPAVTADSPQRRRRMAFVFADERPTQGEQS